MGKRKYFSEFGLNMKNAYGVILQHDQLNESYNQEILNKYPCHIYMITRHPRIYLDHDSVKIDNEYVTGVYRIQHENTFASKSFKIKNNLGTADVHFHCSYPYTKYVIYDSSGNNIAEGNITVLLMMADPSFCFDLEVLYIGQSYGIDGGRTAPDRLATHSTLQQIYAEAIGNSPDKDIWLVLLGFEDPLLLMSFDGTSKEYETSKEEDEWHVKNVFNSEVTEQQRINFTEAALIRYFEPEYNKTFKYNFPNPAHSTYSQCYDLGLNTLSVELQTEELRCRLWSPKTKPSWIHFATFSLYSTELRRAMFQFYHRD